jgi:hypothetical protein
MGTSGVAASGYLFCGVEFGFTVLMGIEVPMLCIPLAAKYRPLKYPPLDIEIKTKTAGPFWKLPKE